MKKLLWLLGFLWSLPLTIVGLLLSLVYQPTTVHWSDGCLELVAGRHLDGKTRIWGRPAAQTFGIVIWYASERDRQSERLRRHERVHTLQAFIGSVFFALAYGLHFLWLLVFVPKDAPTTRRGKPAPRWWRAYWGIWAERRARAKENDPNGWGSLAASIASV